MDSSVEAQPTKLVWPGDVLGRKGMADFLTRSLVEQAITRSETSGLTVSLDGDWGSGKTFFITRWANDLRSEGYPVVIFDAWENDIGDEAAVALMAAIKTELDVWTERLPKNKGIRQKAAQSTEAALSGLRKAIKPASKVIAAGVLKKITGIVAEDFIEACMSTSNDEESRRAETLSPALEAGLDELFKRTLDDHQARGDAIRTFRASVAHLIKILESEAGIKTPIFVFVDEVDRCRPTYAIKLLEEIKHIFGVPKICFVVSTTLTQLTESVCAVYGEGFDGHRYLKRFFDQQYTLPDADGESFAKQLFAEDSIFKGRDVAYGLPKSPGSPSTESVFALISTGYDLDLRSQKQVFSVAASIAAAIPKDKHIFAFWLFFLCALQHKNPRDFDRLMRDNLNHTVFMEFCQKALQRDCEVEHYRTSSPHDRSAQKSKAKISEIAEAFIETSADS